MVSIFSTSIGRLRDKDAELPLLLDAVDYCQFVMILSRTFFDGVCLGRYELLISVIAANEALAAYP